MDVRGIGTYAKVRECARVLDVSCTRDGRKTKSLGQDEKVTLFFKSMRDKSNNSAGGYFRKFFVRFISRDPSFSSNKLTICTTVSREA